MTEFIKLQMFKDQKGGKSDYGRQAFVPPSLPFVNWKAGYFVRSKRSDSPEEWKITKIESADGAMHHEECSVTLENSARELRVVKGTSLRSGYEFSSVGDVVEPPAPPTPDVPEREDVQFLVVNPTGIREYHVRSRGREGSRVIMSDKTVYIVLETPQQIDGLIVKAGTHICSLRGVEQA